MNKNSNGFTIIELIVVVLIIAILIAIAVPTFLGARQRAQERHTPVKGGIVIKRTHTPERIHEHTTMVGKVVTSTSHTHPESWSIKVINCEQFDPCKSRDFKVSQEIYETVEIGKWYGVQS